MPLREDLLEPIAGGNPAGDDLYYSPLFEQIKEMRREDSGGGVLGGAFDSAQQKKIDYRGIHKLASDALARRSKDLRLANFALESQLMLESFPVLAAEIEFLRQLQEAFWENLYPRIEEDGDVDMRMVAVEAAAHSLALAARKVPLTRSGLSFDSYLDSRSVGYEKDATSSEKQAARLDAIDRGRLSAEDFDQAFASTPKAFYVELTEALAESLAALDRLDEFQRRAYGDNYPNLSELRSALDSVRGVAESLLNERRKAEPDAVVAAPAAPEGPECAPNPGGGAAPAVAGGSAGALVQLSDVYLRIVASAQEIFDQDPNSPVAYLICSGLRLGETRLQGETPAPGFAPGPPRELRQLMRNLVSQGAWQRLLRESLAILADPCARAWLDVHRYIWMAAQESGAAAIAGAVVGTVRGLLMVRPELRNWTLEDDTGAANPETQSWLDSNVLQ